MVCLSTTSNAQSHSISGTIKSENISLKNVTIQLFNDDSILIKSELTNDEGYFNITNIDKGNYQLVLSYVGYTSDIRAIIPDSDINIGVVNLIAAHKLLKEVVVTGQKPRFEFDKNKLIFNIDETLRKSSINASALLKKAPGIEIKNDKLTLDGLAGILVTLNGKQVFSGTQEAVKYLNSLSPDNLKAIEIISYPSSKYDKSVNGIINIVLKRDDTQGMNGTVQTYANTGKYASFGGSADLNYRRKTINAYATIRSDNENNYTNGNTSTFITDLTGSSYTERFNTLSKPRERYIRLGLDNSINSNNSISILASWDYKTQKELNNYNQQFYNQGSRIDSSIQMLDNTRLEYRRLFLNANYKCIIDSASNQILNADFSFISNKPLTHSVFYHSYFNSDGEVTRPEYVLNAVIPNYVTIRGAALDYTARIKKSIDFGSGIKLVRSETNNDVRYDSISGATYKTNSQLSSNTGYVENVSAAYVDLSRFDNKWGWEVGLRYELAKVTGETLGSHAALNKSFAGFYPTLLAMYNFDKKNKILFTAKKVISRPNFDQLNPYIRYVSPTYYVQGNQFLQQFNTYILSLKYTYKSRYMATLRYDYADNYIPQDLLIREDQTNITKSTYANAARLSGFQFTLNVPIVINDYWSIENYVNTFYTTSKANSDRYAGLDYSRANVFYQITHSIELPKQWYTELSFGYITATRVNQRTTDPIYTLDLNIMRSFFDERIKCGFELSDILSSTKEKGTTIYNNMVMNFYRFEDARRVGVTFSYDFGSRKIKEHRQRSIGVEDEISRMKK